VIVVGPGAGEAVFARIPPNNWLAIDSTEVRASTGYTSAYSLLESLGFSSAAILLTHPHIDHSQGFGELVSQHASGPIGCSTCWAELREAGAGSADAERVLNLGTAEAALAAIQDRWEREPSTRWDLVQGSTISIGDARVTVLYPDDDAIERFTRRGGDANTVSSPVLLEWFDARIVLGADLPRAQWAKVAAQDPNPDLARHNGLKVPHHGSKRSLHQSFAEPSSVADRKWVVAPWTRSQGPPRFADGGDVDALLSWTGELHFTCIPRAMSIDLQPGDRISRSEVEQFVERIRFGTDIVLEVVDVDPPDSEAWVAVSFTTDGQAGVEYGGAALVVVE
jgi:beta-lactamase superfamily II metal-dependent hydrolase